MIAMKLRPVLRLLPILAVLLQAGIASAQGEEIEAGCGTLYSATQYGPFDYRTASKAQTEVVVVHHFTSEVEHLRGGVKSAFDLGADIDYTLN